MPAGEGAEAAVVRRLMGWVVVVGEGPGGWYAPAEGPGGWFPPVVVVVEVGPSGEDEGGMPRGRGLTPPVVVVGGPGGERSARRECGEPATTRDHGVCTEETLEPGVSTVKIEAAEDGGTEGTDADGDACVARKALSSVGVVE